MLTSAIVTKALKIDVRFPYMRALSPWAGGLPSCRELPDSRLAHAICAWIFCQLYTQLTSNNNVPPVTITLFP